MLRFAPYLIETKRMSTLNIFDIDDTLFYSEANTKVIKDGKVVKTLTPAQLTTYKPLPGEHLDYSEFRSGKQFHKTARPVPHMFKIAGRAANESNSKTIIVTGRADMTDKDLLLKRFRDKGFPVDNVYIERAGNLAHPTPAAKVIIIDKYLRTGQFGRVRLWDDSTANLQAFLNLNRQYPKIIFDAFLVVDGQVKKIK